MRIELAAVAAAMVVILAGCGGESEKVAAPDTPAPPAQAAASPVAAENLKTKAAEAVDAAKVYTGAKRDEYAKSVEGRLQEMNSKIAELKKKAESATADTQAALAEQVKDLESKRESVGKRLAELQTSSSQAWGDMRQGIDAALKELYEGYEKARGRF